MAEAEARRRAIEKASEIVNSGRSGFTRRATQLLRDKSTEMEDFSDRSEREQKLPITAHNELGTTCLADALKERDQLDQQIKELLSAISEHEANREQHPKGPSKRNQKLWATAQRIREERGDG